MDHHDADLVVQEHLDGQDHGLRFTWKDTDAEIIRLATRGLRFYFEYVSSCVLLCHLLTPGSSLATVDMAIVYFTGTLSSDHYNFYSKGQSFRTIRLSFFEQVLP